MRRRLAAAWSCWWGSRASVPRPRRSDWPSERPAEAARRARRQVSYAIKTLPNGLDCRVASRAALRQHQADGAGGRGAGSGGQAGRRLAGGAALLDQGTTTRSAEQIAHTIDSIGGLIGSGSASTRSSTRS